MTEPDFLRTTRASYDAMASDYAEFFHDELAGKPLDRAMFAAFAELVRSSGPVADVGSGPGRAAQRRSGLGDGQPQCVVEPGEHLERVP
ncbi:hypothetical protein ACFLIM_07105 [Nonomuraea sp. M3C6]|uniref:Methyltransferase domain-containing protein n=1 Tax=Nonomuraea marmarensis TaxID=3351344 RepID=A0ABW7A733_9ACTN